MAWGSKVEAGDDAATIKRKVEEEIQRISPETTWEWQPDGGLYTMQRVPGKEFQSLGRYVYADSSFNSFQTAPQF